MRSIRVSGERSQGHGEGEESRRYYRIFVLHHTHWDREWWATLQDFRIRLVELMDALLETLDTDASFRSFLLDSQTIVLRDYLEIRPQQREKLAAYIREGRIQCGPWYILPDEFLLSGEAHIRNLWLGRRVAQDLACPILDVGYIPDTFGHIAQMPQILRGFGIDNAFLWRGRGGDAGEVKQEFLWQAPDGSEVLAHWFPDGYYQMPFLHFGNPDRPEEDKLGRIFRSIEKWGPRATTDVLLMPYGGDHQSIDRDLPAKIAQANRAIADLGEIRWATSQEYVAAIRERNPRLETVRGELRAFGRDYPYMLPGVLSARLYLKQLNFRGQTWLERYAEPLSALAWLRGRRYDADLLWKAWELLVQNHPHDSVCGCSIDQVHREMIPRFDQSRQIAQILAEKGAQHINARLDTRDLAEGDEALVVHNTLPRSRSGWASVWLERSAVSPYTHRLLDSEGNEVPFTAREVEGVRPLTDRYFYTEIGFLADDVPGLGHRRYWLTRREMPLDAKQVQFSAVQPVARLKGSETVTDLWVGQNRLENRWLRVDVDTQHGTLTITDKSSGQVYTGLNDFDDGGDAGDSYNFSAPLNDLLLRSSDGARVHVSVAEAGYGRAALRIDLDWALPEALAPDRTSRSSHYVDTRISTVVTLQADARRVDVTTEWENRSRDHRLRALFPLGAAVEHSSAQGQFAVTRRPVTVPFSGNGWAEPFVPTVPQQGWISVAAGSQGLTIANRGLPEAEVLADGQGTVALTILRAFGWVSREDLLSREGGAGPTTPAPDAQCLGHNRVNYAIVPHYGDWLGARSYRQAEDYLVPLYGSHTGRHAGDLPAVSGLVQLEGRHTLALSACKKAEESDALLLRLWNVASEPTQARVRTTRRVAAARLVDLREVPIADGSLPVDLDGSFILEAPASTIVTVALTLAGAGRSEADDGGGPE